MPIPDAGVVGYAAAFMAFVTTPYLGVGDSSAAFDQAQTDLQSATHKLRKAMDGGYPTRVSATLTFRATFGTTEANFAWNEVGIFDASAGGTMYGRTPDALGTKTSAQTWQLTIGIYLLAV
jgi:hypothetical protein